MRIMLSRPVFWESVVLSLMCLVDAWLTIMLVAHGWASEANPIMAYFLEVGIPVFVLAKVAVLIPGVVSCEFLKTRRYKFALWTMRFAAFGYLMVYVVGDLKVNGLL